VKIILESKVENLKDITRCHFEIKFLIHLEDQQL